MLRELICWLVCKARPAPVSLYRMQYAACTPIRSHTIQFQQHANFVCDRTTIRILHTVYWLQCTSEHFDWLKFCRPTFRAIDIGCYGSRLRLIEAGTPTKIDFTLVVKRAWSQSLTNLFGHNSTT